MSFLYRTACGFILGITAVAPGMSGSVTAIMLGVYSDLITVVSNPFRRQGSKSALRGLLGNLKYLFPLGVGALVSIVLFVFVFSYLFDAHPVPTRALFLGLVVGGLPALKRAVSFRAARFGEWSGFLVTMLLAAGMGILSKTMVTSSVGSAAWYYLAAAGFFGGCAAVIPGMSVSVVLMVFGVYDYLLAAAGGLADDPLHTLSAALPTGAAFVVGAVLISNAVKFALERHTGIANACILGFMTGTVVAIMPSVPPHGFLGWTTAFAALVLGSVISYLFSAKKQG